MHRPDNSERNAKIIDLYLRKKTFGEIAREMRIERNVVAGVIHRAKVANRGGKKFEREDLTGRHFGRLTVLGVAGKNSVGNYVYNCICSCGKKSKVQGGALTSGNTKSCGCLRSETSAKSIRGKRRKRESRLPVYEITRLRDWGWAQKEIAQALEVSRSSVQRVLSQTEKVEA